MNKYWPKAWKKKLPNFLGEDFFSAFDNFEDFDLEDYEPQQQSEQNRQSANKTIVKKKDKPSNIMVNIYESGHELLCVFRVPGLILKEVEIDVYDKTIEVTGSVQLDVKDFRPVHLEIYQGPVKRRVELPYSVRDDKIEATYQHGFLFVGLHRLIRANTVKPKVIIDDLG